MVILTCIVSKDLAQTSLDTTARPTSQFYGWQVSQVIVAFQRAGTHRLEGIINDLAHDRLKLIEQKVVIFILFHSVFLPVLSL
jgi:hypothetical protein